MTVAKPVHAYVMNAQQFLFFKSKTKLRLICDDCEQPIGIGDYFGIYKGTKEFAGFRCKSCVDKLLCVVHTN